MQLDTLKSSMNFFKAAPPVEKKESNFSVFVRTAKKLFNGIRWFKIPAIMVVGVLLLLISFTIAIGVSTQDNSKTVKSYDEAKLYLDVKVAEQRAKLVAFQIENEKQTKIQEDALKKVNAEKYLFKQRVEFISKMSPARMDAIKAHILKTRDKELSKIVEGYWTYVFINENETELKMEMINKLSHEQFNTVSSFYNDRAREMFSTFQFIKSGHPELITLTHDGQDPMERLIYWDTDAQNKQISFLDSTDTFLNESTEYLKSPAKLAKFLASHKALIDAKKPF